MGLKVARVPSLGPTQQATREFSSSLRSSSVGGTIPRHFGWAGQNQSLCATLGITRSVEGVKGKSGNSSFKRGDVGQGAKRSSNESMNGRAPGGFEGLLLSRFGGGFALSLPRFQFKMYGSQMIAASTAGSRRRLATRRTIASHFENPGLTRRPAT